LSAHAPRLNLVTGCLASLSIWHVRWRAPRAMSNSMLNELRELVWLASVVSGLSIVGVGLAVALVVVRAA